MPRYVHVLGYVADGVSDLEEADELGAFFRGSDDSDESLPRRLAALLDAMPGVKVWVLTRSETPEPLEGYVLHVIGAERQAMVELDRAIEAGARGRLAPPKGWGRLGPTEIAQAILGGSESFPWPSGGAPRTDWLARWTSGREADRERALRAAKRIATSLARDDDTRARRRALVEPLAQALSSVDDDGLRGRLWEIAGWLNAEKIRDATLEGLRRGDRALEDAHVERQRTLLFETLPAAVGAAMREDPDAAWLPRAQAILARYDLAPT